MNSPANRLSRFSDADPDEDLLREARNAPEGDLRAFEQLVLRYQRRVVTNCRYITRDQNNAEDLAQEVLVKVFLGSAVLREDRRLQAGSIVLRLTIAWTILSGRPPDLLLGLRNNTSTSSINSKT